MSSITESSDPGKNPPQASIDVPEKWMDEVARLEPEQSVRIVLEGKVKTLDKQSVEMSGFGFPGRLTIEVRRLRAVRDDNVFEEMSEDD